MKAGTLVQFRGSIGLVLSKVKKPAAHPSDVWVKWNNEPTPVWENSKLLEVLSENR